jgi:hypothetical protein
MRFVTYLRDQRWETLLGYGLFVALMVAGYYYNITFIQLGLIDLGTRLVGMSETAVSTWMAGLALCTLVVAVVTGVTMDRRGWSTDLRTKLRLLFGVVLYGQLVFGRWLPIERQAVATVAGIGLFLLGMDLLSAVPYLGALVQFVLIAVGFGAVLNTYFGLQRFEPAGFPSDASRR